MKHKPVSAVPAISGICKRAKNASGNICTASQGARHVSSLTVPSYWSKTTGHSSFDAHV